MSKTYLALTIVGLAIVVSLGIAYYNRTRTASSQSVVTAEVPVGTAQITVAPSATSVKVGDQITATITIDTKGGESVGTDVVLDYDPSILEVVDADSAAAGVQITKGTLYDFVPLNTVLLATGRISYSAAQQPTNPSYKGAGTLATVTFKAKAPGDSQLAFEFQPGSLRDTNIVKANDSRDLLSKVTNAEVTVTN